LFNRSFILLQTGTDNTNPSKVVSYSYQHIQGEMLVALNKISMELCLTNAEYRVLANLISLWNMKKGFAYPTLELLLKQCAMGKQTLLKTLKKLKALNLIFVVKERGKSNRYYLSTVICKNH
jgi:hypothetical protein